MGVWRNHLERSGSWRDYSARLAWATLFAFLNMEFRVSKKIGLIGVGLMGMGIASNLARKGQHLTVLEHEGNQPLDSLLAAGVSTAKTPAALASQVDVLILCVTGSPQVEAVLRGEQGVLKGMRQGLIVIDCSTAVPTSTEALAQQVQAAGGFFLDSPMTRTPKEAAEGRLNLLVGGDAELFGQCRPILACFAENIIHAGPVGAGHSMKLLHNYVSLGSVALTSCSPMWGSISGAGRWRSGSQAGGGGAGARR